MDNFVLNDPIENICYEATPSKHQANTKQTPTKHQPNTYQTPTKHQANTKQPKLIMCPASA